MQLIGLAAGDRYFGSVERDLPNDHFGTDEIELFRLRNPKIHHEIPLSNYDYRPDASLPDP